MIKFTFDNGKGGKVLGLGLSRMNCERLLKGQPIVVKPAEMGITDAPFEIALFAGETELDLMAALQKAGMEFPTDPAKIHIDPRVGET